MSLARSLVQDQLLHALAKHSDELLVASRKRRLVFWRPGEDAVDHEKIHCSKLVALAHANRMQRIAGQIVELSHFTTFRAIREIQAQFDRLQVLCKPQQTECHLPGSPHGRTVVERHGPVNDDARDVAHVEQVAPEEGGEIYRRGEPQRVMGPEVQRGLFVRLFVGPQEAEGEVLELLLIVGIVDDTCRLCD